MASNYLYKREFVKSQKEKGLCIECKNTVTNGRSRCDICQKRRSENKKIKYNLWKGDNKCCECGKAVLGNKNYCEKHYLMKISHSRLGTSKYWKDLKLLMEQQQYKCALTGDNISFEQDIELDHILPIYRGGRNELKNIQWTTRKVNCFKRANTQDELKILCEKILSTI